MDLINVPQLITQILGFLVTLWILSAVAWKPLLKMLDDRSAKIAGDFAAADKARAEMEALKAEFEAKMKEIEGAARSRISEAAREGEKLAAQIVEESRSKAREQTERALADIHREKDKALAEMRAQMVDSVVKATERVIHERMDDAGQRKLIERFLGEVGTLK